MVKFPVSKSFLIKMNDSNSSCSKLTFKKIFFYLWICAVLKGKASYNIIISRTKALVAFDSCVAHFIQYRKCNFKTQIVGPCCCCTLNPDCSLLSPPCLWCPIRCSWSARSISTLLRERFFCCHLSLHNISVGNHL